MTTKNDPKSKDTQQYDEMQIRLELRELHRDKFIYIRKLREAQEALRKKLKLKSDEENKPCLQRRPKVLRDELTKEQAKAILCIGRKKLDRYLATGVLPDLHPYSLQKMLPGHHSVPESLKAKFKKKYDYYVAKKRQWNDICEQERERLAKEVLDS